MNEHQHQWKLGVHVDGCHYFASTYGCECGATMGTIDERDFTQPYSTEWMLDDCKRCLELLKGAAPTHQAEITPAVAK